MKAGRIGTVFIGVSFLLMLGTFGYIFAVQRAKSQAAAARTRALLLACASASSNYARVFGKWPSSLEELKSNSMNLVFIVDPTEVDSWGHRIKYIPFAAEAGVGWVQSLGADGQIGGSGPNTDITIQFGFSVGSNSTVTTP